MEHNPNHPVTAGMREQWHKIVAILVSRTERKEIIISPREIETFARSYEGCAVAIRELPDGLHLWLVTDEEACRLAKKEGGLPT